MTASLQDLQTWDMDMRSRWRPIGYVSIAILDMTSAGAELATFTNEHIVRVSYKSLDSTFSCLCTCHLRLAPNTGCE